MSVKVIIPTPLRVYAGKADSTEVSAKTVGEALGQLTVKFGDLRKHLFTEDGKLRSFVTCPRKIRRPKMATRSVSSLLSPADSFSDAHVTRRICQAQNRQIFKIRNAQ
jgi:adenylyltransferase/sulfurtransferase